MNSRIPWKTKIVISGDMERCGQTARKNGHNWIRPRARDLTNRINTEEDEFIFTQSKQRNLGCESLIFCLNSTWLEYFISYFVLKLRGLIEIIVVNLTCIGKRLLNYFFPVTWYLYLSEKFHNSSVWCKNRRISFTILR